MRDERSDPKQPFKLRQLRALQRFCGGAQLIAVKKAARSLADSHGRALDSCFSLAFWKVAW